MEFVNLNKKVTILVDNEFPLVTFVDDGKNITIHDLSFGYIGKTKTLEEAKEYYHKKWIESNACHCSIEDVKDENGWKNVYFSTNKVGKMKNFKQSFEVTDGTETVIVDVAGEAFVWLMQKYKKD